MRELRQSLPAAEAWGEAAEPRTTVSGANVVSHPQSTISTSTPHWGYETVKRALDITIAFLLLTAASPLLAVIAVLIRLDSPGPVLFKQRRVGYQGRTFWCYKFRTMVDDAESLLRHDTDLGTRFAASWKLHDDPRLTKLGRWLRKTSMDELPQLVNVLRGDMSLVGPRPVQPRELEEHFGKWAPVILSVRPGITGLWQVSGRSSVPYPQRVALDITYITRRSLLYDTSLLLKTIPAVISGKGAV